MIDLLFLICAGVLAGGMNAVAGGGSFVSLPALLAVGVPPVAANASSTVALFPGTAASALAWRHHYRPLPSISNRRLLLTSGVGGLMGGLLLLFTPDRAFDAAVPWLLLIGALTFAFGGRAGLVLRRKVRIGGRTLTVTQFLLGVYGGYFGGAVGILMMASWSLMADIELHAMSAVKAVMVGAANTPAVFLFIAAGIVAWAEVGALLVGALIGGYGGAALARHQRAARLRLGINLINAVVVVAFFARAWMR